MSILFLFITWKLQVKKYKKKNNNNNKNLEMLTFDVNQRNQYIILCTK